MTATMVFNQIMALPEREQARLVKRLARETELLDEQWAVKTFEARRHEKGGRNLGEIFREHGATAGRTLRKHA